MGQIFGGFFVVADVRDLVANLMYGDYIFAGLNAAADISKADSIKLTKESAKAISEKLNATGDTDKIEIWYVIGKVKN